MSRYHRGLGAGIAALLVVLLVPLAGTGGAVAQAASATAARTKPKVDPALLDTSGRGLPANATGGLNIDRRGRILAVVRATDTSAATLASLRGAGASVTHVATTGEITARIPRARLAAVAALPQVRYVRPEHVPLVHGAAGRAGAAAPTAPTCGSVTSEADDQLRAHALRDEAGVDGSGLKIGVLSDSWDAREDDDTDAEDDVESGDLPGPGNPCGRTTPVEVLEEIEDPAGAIDEGRAMAQLVHDLAPGAALAFASAFNGENAFADAIRALRTAGSHVIVDDITYFAEPFYQRGPVAVAADQVVADGASYFSSVGNSNSSAGGVPIGSYESMEYRPTTCPPVLLTFLADCHDFDPGPGTDSGERLDVPVGASVNLDVQWAEPTFGVTTDLDVYLVDQTGTVLLPALFGASDNTASQRPYELVQLQAAPPSFDLVIGRFSGNARPRLKWVSFGDLTGVEYPTGSGGDVVGPTTFGHNATAQGSTGAVPYDNPRFMEQYSSAGPVTLLFGDVTSDTAAPPLAEPAVISAPDFSATDGTLTTFFYDNGTEDPPHRFFGTSAAAPHAAAVAALLRECHPTTTTADVRDRLAVTAVAVPGGSAGQSGAGLVDALAAGRSFCPSLTESYRASVADVRVSEAAGTMIFTVSLDRPVAAGPGVTLRAATANGTASAGQDYTATGTTLTFGPGQQRKAVSVPLLQDRRDELAETVRLKLSAPGAGVSFADALGIGTIVDDDPAPSLRVLDVNTFEGQSGTRAMVFTVRLSAPTHRTVTVDYQTANGSAVAPADYRSTSGTLTFAPGSTTRTVAVQVVGDTATEPSESLFLGIFGAAGAAIADPNGTGVILNDD